MDNRKYQIVKRERRLNQTGETSEVNNGEIVLIKGEEKDRGQWKIQ
jgi:hypothetical protein